jgi:2-dehydro-3-deoxyphosphogluconate aldolase/(4S)-4-hydroxy-2-oxoglutarate aldolase
MKLSRLAASAFLIDTGVVAVVRADSSEQLVEVAGALSAGGVKAIEITFTTPDALAVIAAVSRALAADCLIGAGTVLDAETARAAILAGAEFLVAPILDIPTIELAHRYDKVVFPGAYTPTEILRAYQAGADFVKVFPADTLGPEYIRAVKAPLPQVRICPTGGVTAENAGEWIKAGADCVAAGGSLVSKKFLSERNTKGITETAAKFVAAVKGARR